MSLKYIELWLKKTTNQANKQKSHHASLVFMINLYLKTTSWEMFMACLQIKKNH